MSINISGYEFEGPFPSKTSLKNQSGVYMIHYKNNQGEYFRLDCGESEDVKTRVENHDRESCWTRNAKGDIRYSAYYCLEDERMRVEQEIRSEFTLPCGDR